MNTGPDAATAELSDDAGKDLKILNCMGWICYFISAGLTPFTVRPNRRPGDEGAVPVPSPSTTLVSPRMKHSIHLLLSQLCMYEIK